MSHDELKRLASVDVGEYEGLDGGSGREIFFRPKRFGLDDLAPVRVAARVDVEDATYSAALLNISQNGASLVLPLGVQLCDGDLIRLTLQTDDHDAYDGEVRVQWSREEQGKPVIGVAFLDSLIDLDDVLRLRDLQTVRSEVARSSRGAWRDVTHDRFKAAVGDFALFLADTAENLGRVEAALSPQSFYAESHSASRKALFRAIQEDVVPSVIHYSAELDAALRLAGKADRAGLQEFSLRHLQSYLLQAPWMHRAFHKPLGYPGDFEVMNFVYGRELVGPTLFAKALHFAFLEVPASEAVRQRKELVKAQLLAKLGGSGDSQGALPPGGVVRILSIAAGPAQELYELLRDIEECPETEILLFDQDAGALAHAHRRLTSIVSKRWKDRVRVTYLHDSIKRLLVDPEIFRDRGLFDAIICAGFFDYLRVHSAIRTTKTIYSYLAPGGTAYIGNMVPENPDRWLMEMHLDWHLIYRTREEMISFARAAAVDAEVGIIEEQTKINPFLSVQRPL